MKRSIIVVLLLLTMLLLGGASSDSKTRSAISFKTYPASKLKEDFKQFQDIINFQHPKLYTNKAELERLFNTQSRLIKGKMEELEFYRILAPIVSKLNCGHTSLAFSTEFENYLNQNGRYLPLRVKIIKDRAYVYQNLTKTEITAGSEILDINGKSIKEIINTFLANITADGTNTSKKYYVMNHWFFEQYFSYIDAPEEFTITLIGPGETQSAQKRFPAVNKETFDLLIRNLNPDEQDDQQYSYEFEKDYAIITIKSFGFYDYDSGNKFRDFIDDFFKTLSDRKISTLIVDLRDNWGGDPLCSSYLFTYLINKPTPYFSSDTPYYIQLESPMAIAANNFKGNLFTLINGASFSSTGHLCSLLKYHHIGTLIGDETGGSYVCTDGSAELTLMNTHVRLHCSTTAFKTAVSGLTPGRGIMPDYFVSPAIEDYLNGKDVEKAFAIDLMGLQK